MKKVIVLSLLRGKKRCWKGYWLRKKGMIACETLYFNRKKLNVKGTLRSIQIAGNLTRFLQVPIKGFTALGVQVALS